MQRLGAPTLLLISALLVLPSALGAQQEMRTVTGTVTVEDTRQPLAGVTVTVKGTLLATLTDSRGYFSRRVPSDAETLVFTYLGYRTEEAPVSDQVDVMMSIAPVGLEGIVVTALGITREKASLGYSVQDVSGDELAEVPEFNIVNSLQGNVAGVQITNAGPTGGTSRIVIRGANSIASENQPLFIVDGIPLDNWSARNYGYWSGPISSGIDYGNTIQDLDPHNIENISVLKGPNAAALYGSRAANGAIVITTKSGLGAPAGRLGVTVTISGTAETPLRLPDYQDQYGQGYNGQFRFVDGAGRGTYDYFDESWGPRLCQSAENCDTLIDQFTGPQQPWVAYPDNVSSYFQTGGTLNTNIAVSNSGERHHVRLSLTDTRLNSISPGSSIHRIGLSLKGGVAITDRLSAEASLNYFDNAAENRMGTGYNGDNPMSQFIWFGRQVDMEALRHYRCTGDEPTPCIVGGQYNWNYNYHNNPFWEMYVNGNNDERDRLFFNASASYQLTDWITVTGQVGRDWYRFHRKDVTAPQSLNGRFGGFWEATYYRAETNWDLILTGTRQLSRNFSLDLRAGGNIRQNDYEESGVRVTRLTAPGIYSIDNAAVTPAPWDYVERKEVLSLYGAATLGYRTWLTVDLTGRNDWSSTLPEGGNSYFYPSVSTAFLFSEAFGLRSSFFSSGKLRASWTQAGNDAAPYQLFSVLDASMPWGGGTPMFSVRNTLANANLKPERTTAWEFGTDLGLFDERLGFVLTHYRSATANQIMEVGVSRATGYETRMLNAGEVANQGWELLVRASPLRSTTGPNWDLTVNWSKNTSKVTELYEGIETLVLAMAGGNTYWYVNVEARQGEPYGTLLGNPVLRCGVTEDPAYDDICAGNEGLPILGEDGNTQVDPVRRVLGNYNPDWIGGIQNRFSWGRWDLSFLFQGQYGGDVYSVSDYLGKYAGVLEVTLEGRENDWDDPGVLVRGVFDNGTTNEGEINGENGLDVRVVAQDYWEGIWDKHSESILDATYVKLRELRIGYELPGSWVKWTGFNGGKFSLIGRNLLLWSKCDNIDPETAFDASNVQGIEFGQHPSVRSYGFSLSLW
jgi:TonB-linked SusC/RagA family outer membrane protein